MKIFLVVAHSYNKDIALSIIRETKEIYTGMFGNLKETVEKDWIK